MTFDPVAYKQAVTQEWERAAQGWHRWIPSINDWLSDATGMMLDQAGVIEGSRVIDIASGDGGEDPLLFNPGKINPGAAGLTLARTWTTWPVQSWCSGGSCRKSGGGGIPGCSGAGHLSTAAICIRRRMRAMATRGLGNTASDA